VAGWLSGDAGHRDHWGWGRGCDGTRTHLRHHPLRSAQESLPAEKPLCPSGDRAVAQALAVVTRRRWRSYPNEEQTLLYQMQAGYYPPMTHSFAHRNGLIVAALACAIIAGCGTSHSRPTLPDKADRERRLPVYAAGKLIGYCRGDFSGSGPLVSFHAHWKHGSREASLCVGGVGEHFYDALYKVAGSHGLNGARLLHLVRVHTGSAIKGRVVGVYTAKARLVGFCVPGHTTGSLVCAGQGRQISIYNLNTRLLGDCTPSELVSGRGNLVCTQEVPSEGPSSVAT
jgi:hypothetical protein